MDQSFVDKKVKFFTKIIDLLYIHGWSEDLLRSCNKHCGFAAGYDHILFSGGMHQIVQEFESWQDEQAIKSLSSKKPKGVRGKIKAAMLARIAGSFDQAQPGACSAGEINQNLACKPQNSF